MRAPAAGLSVLALVLVLAGCSGSPTAGGVGSSAPSAVSARGPWAGAIRATYNQSDNVQVKSALSDGEISEQEVAFFQERILQCLEGLGLRGKWTEDGALSYSGSRNVARESINDCNTKNGLDLITLHQAIARNPDNLNEGEIMVACLRRVRAVGPEYTAEMFKANVGLEGILKNSEFEECNSDPLNYKK